MEVREENGSLRVCNPAGRPRPFTGDSLGPERRIQIGHFSDGSVETAATPAANNVNLLVQTVVLNYMALHGAQNLFAILDYFPAHGLDGVALRDSRTAFNPIVNGKLV